MRTKSRVFQFGLGICLLGLLVKVAIALAGLLGPIAHIAIIAGIVIMVIGLVTPGRR